MNLKIHCKDECALNFNGGHYSRQKIYKCIIVMKLSILLLLFSLQVSATAFSQQITLSYKNTPIAIVLSSIRQQSRYYFVMPGDLKQNYPVSLTVKNATIEETLQTLFADQPFIYKVEDNLIVIQKKSSFDNSATLQAVQKNDLDGVVIDQDSKPLEGASVLLKEKNKGSVTDKIGRFHFKDVPENGILLIRMVGHETKEVKYQNGTVPTIVLREVEADLKEIQVIAYGTVNKKFSTSNINGITAEDIATQPINNPLIALAGRVPGLFIQQTGGVSGSPINVTIQGKNSLANGNDPFYVIDGIPYSSHNLVTSLPGSSMPSSGSGGSTFSYINPADIESIEILKDADATAIYGSRAANGAILITTKKGKAGATKFDLNSQVGWGQITRKIKLLNTLQYLEIRKEAYKNSGTIPGDADYDINGVWDQNHSTDWQDVLVGGTAKTTSIQANVSGGSITTQFLAGVGYLKETTVYPGDLGDTKVSAHFNINHTSTNQKFKFNLSGSLLQDNNTLAVNDLMAQAVSLAPNAPALYNADGTINWGKISDNPAVYTFDNPIASLLQKYNGKTYNLINNAFVGYEIIPGLELKSTFGYNRITTDEYNINPQSSFRPDYTYLTRSSNFSNKHIGSYIVEPQVTFTKEALGGHIDALLGSTFQENESAIQPYNATGFTTDGQLKNVLAATTVTPLESTNQATYRYSAIFGRLNYRYDNKYIINLTARRDGSSRFGSKNLFNSFYSVGGAWLFGDERFTKELLPFLSLGKLRLTYGTSGNDQIGDYGFLNLYGNYNVDVPYQGTVGLSPSGHSNPFLQWEETKKINVGIDLGFFSNDVTITANYFRNRSSNQLINDPVPIYTGFTNFKRNLSATLQNTGWELSADATIVKDRAVTWRSSFNMTIPENKLVSYPNLAISLNANKYVIGQPFNIQKVFHYAGVNSQTGLYEFIDSKGERTSTPSDPTDKTSLVNLNPKFYGGFYNSVSYKGFSLDILFQYVKQTGANYRFGNYPGVTIYNQPATVYKRWKAAGDVSDIQKITTDFSDFDPSYEAALNSDRAFSDASYIRLKNLSLSYALPSLWMQKAHISQARVYVQGQNLLTITNYLGSDPESQFVGSLPPLKFFIVGFQLTL
jgi:TonB-linked SusC/RagA family outer membrane protein